MLLAVYCWSACGVCVLNFSQSHCAWPKDNLSFAVRICYRSWSQSYINSCFDWCNYHLVMVCQFCDVTFVYGESLQWGFGFYLLWFYRVCNRIQGRTPVLVHVLFWSIRRLLLVWTKLDIRVVELHQILVSEVELVCDPMVVVWVFQIWFLKWTLVWDVGFEIHQFWFLRWISCLFLVDLVVIHQSFISEVDLAGVVVRTFSCWSDFNMRASVKHELLVHGFHDELFN